MGNWVDTEYGADTAVRPTELEMHMRPA